MKFNKLAVGLGAILLIFAGGCDLEVPNLNQPETERVVALPADLENLIWGGYNTYWKMTDDYLGLRPIISVASMEHSAYPANFGMVEYSLIPRRAVDNSPAHTFASHFEYTWYRSYRAIVAASNGLKGLQTAPLPGEGTLTSAQRTARAEAFSRFVQGVGHGALAMVYDKGVVFDETKSALEEQPLVPYTDLFQAAMGYLDQAITLATNNTFTIPTTWTAGHATSNTALVRLARQYKAYYRANLPRTPQDAVDWNSVIADIDAAGPVNMVFRGLPGDPWHTYGLYYISLAGWSQVHNALSGMSDQSGEYQKWMARPWLLREPFLYVTPDKRFPQGATVAAQQAAPGTYVMVPATPGGQWARPDRGTWRWSYYRDRRHDAYVAALGGDQPHLTLRYMKLLKAEALYRTGDLAGAATIINETRVANGGLVATNAAGLNSNGVPKGLPTWAGFDANGYGNLLEMLKWEFRMETYHHGFAPNYFNGRRWGDLMAGTFLHLPIPGKELETLQKGAYTTGGGQPGSAPVGTYRY